MSAFESLLLSWLLNSLWQIPLLFAAAFIAARLLRPAGPALEHRVWVAALLCQGLLPALSVVSWERLHIAWPWHGQTASLGHAGVSVQMGAGSAFASLRLQPSVLAALSAAWLALTGYFLARFVWQCFGLSALGRSATPLNPTGDVALSCTRWSGLFGIGPVALDSSRQIFAPVTIGIFRKRVLLPAGLVAHLPLADLDTAIAHEFAHIRRSDFLKNLVYELLSLPVSYHPAIWLTRQRIMETREMVCDQMAAGVFGNQEYAQSLLRLASLLLQGKSVAVPHAIGVFDANTLERRLMKLTESRNQVGRLRRYLSLGACLALGVATATSALALRLAVDSETAKSDSSRKPAPHAVPPETMAAHIISRVTPAYPAEAKTARIQGSVVLNAIIGKTGHVEKLTAASGPKELQASAIEAVRQWTYQPILLNGAPVEVKTTITVTYTLEN